MNELSLSFAGLSTSKDLDEEEQKAVKSAADQIAKIVSEVKKGDNKSAKSDESLRKEFEKLVDLLKPEEMQNKVSQTNPYLAKIPSHNIRFSLSRDNTGAGFRSPPSNIFRGTSFKFRNRNSYWYNNR